MEPVVHASREIDRSKPESFCADGAPWERTCMSIPAVHFLDTHLTEVIEAVAKRADQA
jgi:hypothetical protein